MGHRQRQVHHQFWCHGGILCRGSEKISEVEPGIGLMILTFKGMFKSDPFITSLEYD